MANEAERIEAEYVIDMEQFYESMEGGTNALNQLEIAGEKSAQGVEAGLHDDAAAADQLAASSESAANKVSSIGTAAKSASADMATVGTSSKVAAAGLAVAQREAWALATALRSAARAVAVGFVIEGIGFIIDKLKEASDIKVEQNLKIENTVKVENPELLRNLDDNARLVKQAVDQFKSQQDQALQQAFAATR